MPVPGLDPGIVAGIHVFTALRRGKDLDGRNKSEQVRPRHELLLSAEIHPFGHGPGGSGDAGAQEIVEMHDADRQALLDDKQRRDLR